MDSPHLGDLLTEQQAAKRLTLSTATLRKWRSEQHGPAFIRLGSRIKYPSTLLEDWLRDGLVHTQN